MNRGRVKKVTAGPLAGLIEQISEHALDAFVVMDDEGRVTAWNRRAEEIFGFSREEAIGRLLSSLVIPERFIDSHTKGLAELRRTGASKVLNRRMKVTGKRKLGEEFVAEITIQKLAHDDRDYFSAFVRDVGKQEALSLALRESEERFRSLVERTPVGIYVHREFKPLFVNQAFCNLLGYDSPADFMTSVPSMLETYAPGDRDRMREILRNRMTGTGSPVEYEYESLCADGSVRALRNHVRVINWDGKPAVQCAVTDVTEAGRSSSALKLVNRIAGALVNARTEDDAIRSVLGAICDVTGWGYGESWLAGDEDEILRPGPTWTGSEAALEQFASESSGFTFRVGEGVPGRVWRDCAPEWISDLESADKRWFLRKQAAAKTGLRAACAVPVTDAHRVCLVLCFFEQTARAMDPQWLDALVASVAPLGIYLRHLATEKQLKRYEEIVARSPELIAFVDLNDTIIAVSSSFARRFKYRREDVVGKSMQDLFGERYFQHIQKPRILRCLKGREVRHLTRYDFPFSGETHLDVCYTPYAEITGTVTGVLMTARDVTDMQLAQQRVRYAREQLRKLAARLEDVREQERRQIAREVHDDLAQRLAVLRMDLESQEQSLASGDDAAKASISRSANVVEEMLDHVRALYSRLRPAILDELGLDEATKWLVNDFARRSGWAVTTNLALDDIPLDEELRVAVFRVLEEALTNVARHANAGRVEVTICKRRRRLFMEVRDDGRGITPAQFDAPGSVGIAAMRERAAGLGGRFRMLRDPVAGTRLRLWVPVSKNRGGAS